MLSKLLLSLGISLCAYIQTSQEPIFRVYNGTAIVAFWSKDKLWLAADSKVVIRTKGQKDSILYVKKVYNKGKYSYALAGKAKVDGIGPLSFSADIDLDNLIPVSHNGKELIKKFSDIIIPKMEKALDLGFKLGKLDFDSIKNFPILDLILCEFQAPGSPVVYNMPYIIEGTVSNWHVAQISKEILPIKNFPFTSGGNDAEVDYFLHNINPYYFETGDINCKLDSLIKLAEKYHGYDVGGPINIVEVSRSRVIWHNNYDCMKPPKKR